MHILVSGSKYVYIFILYTITNYYAVFDRDQNVRKIRENGFFPELQKISKN
jgi:hypothetical protein